MRYRNPMAMDVEKPIRASCCRPPIRWNAIAVSTQRRAGHFWDAMIVASCLQIAVVRACPPKMCQAELSGVRWR